MKDDYVFVEPAQIELEKEVKYYNEQQAGLGYDFALIFDALFSDRSEASR